MPSLRTRLDHLTGAPPATFWWLWGGSFVSALATFVLPFLTLYLGSLGFGVEAAGRVGALYGVGMLAASPLAGGLADRLGRRPTMIGALSATAAATALLASASSPAAIGGAVLLVGASAAAYRSASQALIADVVPAAARTRAYGMLRWGNNLGLAVSSLLGGALAAWGFGKLFLIDAATTLAFALVVAARVPETRPERPGGRADPAGPAGAAPLRDGTFVALIALQVGFLLPLWQFQVSLPAAMAAQGHGPAAFGRVFAVNGVLITLLQPSTAAWAAGRDAARVLASGALLVGLGYGAYAFCHGAPAFALATGLWSLGEIVFMPTAAATVATLSPAALRGRYQGVWTLAIGLGVVASPAAGSALMARRGPAALWSSCLLAGVLAALGLLALGPALRRRGCGATRR
ncbi:MAG TPA: MFS transporter [Anaeromyxobacter sp.]|nr:MFS transporter [Anaeromyxobacter sp.]